MRDYSSEELLKLPRWQREAFMRSYAKRMLERTLSNIMNCADNHQANSDKLADLVFEVSELLDNF